MKRYFFYLFVVLASSPALSMEKNSYIGQTVMVSGMNQCVSEAVKSYQVDFDIASEYCQCAMSEMIKVLSLEQMIEYYKYSKEIQDAIYTKCLPQTKKLVQKIFTDAITPDCVDSLMKDDGVGFAQAVKFCYCASSTVIDKLDIKHLVEYYKYADEIEDAMKDAAIYCILKEVLN